MSWLKVAGGDLAGGKTRGRRKVAKGKLKAGIRLDGNPPPQKSKLSTDDNDLDNI